MLTISIVIYQTDPLQLANCITSIRRYSRDYKVIFIDNSPTNYLKQMLPLDARFSYIHQPSNPGFGKSHNLALQYSLDYKADYHLVLNADVYFGFGVLEALENFMNAHTDVGLIMPKVLYPDGSIQYLCKLIPTPADLFIRRFIPNKVLRDWSSYRFELRFTGYDEIMDVPYLSGCFMFLRVESLRLSGIFDERFFMYPEDIDLTRRINKYARTLFYPFVSVHHEYGGGSKKSIKLFAIHVLNLIKYFNKWGWILDAERHHVNKRTCDQLKRFAYQKSRRSPLAVTRQIK